jgi:hypothetical protein
MGRRMTTENESRETHDKKDEEELRNARRKAISNLVPATVRTLSQTQKIVSPMAVAERAVSEYDELISRRLNSYQEFLKQKFPQLHSPEVTLEGESGFSIVLEREQVLSGVIEEYVKRYSLDERWFDFPFSILPRTETKDSDIVENFDAQLSLPRGSVNMKLIRQKPEPSFLPSLQERTLRAKSSETWLIVTSGLEKREELDFQVDPLFANERKFLPGRILVLGLNTVIAERIHDNNFVVSTSEIQDGKIKITFSETL